MRELWLAASVKHRLLLRALSLFISAYFSLSFCWVRAQIISLSYVHYPLRPRMSVFMMDIHVWLWTEPDSFVHPVVSISDDHKMIHCKTEMDSGHHFITIHHLLRIARRISSSCVAQDSMPSRNTEDWGEPGSGDHEISILPQNPPLGQNYPLWCLIGSQIDFHSDQRLLLSSFINV